MNAACGVDVPVAQLDRRVGFERERAARRAKDSAVGVTLDLVPGAAVVEARRYLEPESHRASHRDHPAHNALAGLACEGLSDRHEVLDLTHSLRREEASDE